MSEEQNINSIFEKAKKEIAELKDDWDSYGAKKIKEETLKKVSEIINDVFKLCMNHEFEWVMPDMSYGSNGEIEIRWINKQFTLILIIPENNSDNIIFLCKNEDKKFKGCIAQEKVTDLYLSCVKKM